MRSLGVREGRRKRPVERWNAGFEKSRQFLAKPVWGEVLFFRKTGSLEPFSWPTREQGLGVKNGKPAKRQLQLSY
jgi:hypothetical protein